MCQIFIKNCTLLLQIVIFWSWVQLVYVRIFIIYVEFIKSNSCLHRSYLDGEVLLLLEESDKHKTLVTKGVEVIEDAPIYRIQRKMLIFLGQISSDLHYLLLPSEEEMSNRAVAWDPLHSLEFDIPFPDLLLSIRLDNLLPRIIELSLDATHR